MIIILGACSQDLDKRIISLDNITAGRPYSPAVEVGNTLYLSGQIAVDPSSGEMIEGGIEDQTDQVLKNIKAIVEKAGYSMSDVVKCNVMLANIEFYGSMNNVYKTYFQEDPPARKAFAVKDLPLGALVEIDAVAIK
jgi:2-iminobutanoate/2-iminopropanoate deaminase